MPKFTLQYIDIKPECSRSIRKNLVPGRFDFTIPKDYVSIGQNIMIEAIVGMNGSGKSALLELIFRMINNFSAYFHKNFNRPEADNLTYVGGIYADLHYIVDDEEGVLSCRDMLATLSIGNIKVRMGKSDDAEFAEFKSGDMLSKNDIIDIASKFFYTIAVNYSLQAYITYDYNSEQSYTYDYNKKKWIRDKKSVWIDGLFHKNDGYMTPINLNPYRNKGVIDMKNEMSLTMYRISAILIELQRIEKQQREQKHDENIKIDYVDGYSLSKITYKLNKAKIVKDFSEEPPHESEQHKFKRIIDKFKLCCSNEYPNSYANLILKNFKILQHPDVEIAWIARLYVVRKILNIAATYPSYEKFRTLGNVNLAIDAECPGEKRGLVKKLAHQVKYDKTHISAKVNQTINFIKRLHNAENVNKLYSTFTYDYYNETLDIPCADMSIYNVINTLPPPFFTSEIYLRNAHGKEVPFRRMSSGERQFMFSTSSVIYHILNIRSIHKNRCSYRNINIVLDEIEICFHPEYQRTFLDKFVSLLNTISINNAGGINILLTTHSPFILSDIEKDNVLYLENGESQPTEKFINPYAANVNDILRQDFFMKNGFMGAIAQKRIRRLIKFLTSEPERGRSIDLSLAKTLIDKIGDPFLKQNLQSLYDNYIKKNNILIKTKEERIKELEEEIRKLKEENE